MCTASIAKWVGVGGASVRMEGSRERISVARDAWIPGAAQVVFVEWGWNTVRSHLTTPRKENGIVIRVGLGEGEAAFLTSAAAGAEQTHSLRCFLPASETAEEDARTRTEREDASSSASWMSSRCVARNACPRGGRRGSKRSLAVGPRRRRGNYQGACAFGFSL